MFRKFMVGFIAFAALASSLNAARFLFDYTKDETAGNADWTIDDDFPYPYPPYPSNGDDWLGGISDWGYDLWVSGHEVVTLPPGSSITYGDTTNPLDLSNFDVFIVCEPQDPFTQDEIDAILQFVSDGGGLFMVADHNASDRNNNGWDSPRIWNLFEPYFGIHFHVTGDPNNSVSIHPNYNISNDPDDPVIHGEYGDVHAMSFYAATVMSLDVSVNPMLRGHVWYDDVNGSYVMFATGSYGNGKIAALTDSSPVDDGTGRPGNSLYDGWTERGVENREAVLNASIWLAGETSSNIPPFIGNIVQIPAYPEPNDTVTIKAEVRDQSAIAADSIFVSVDSSDFVAFGHFDRIGDTSFYHIQPYPVGTYVSYYLWAMDDSGATTTSEIRGYTVMPPTGSPIRNPGFEVWVDDSPAFWIRQSGITWAKDSTHVHSGNYSLMVNSLDRKNIYSDTLTIIPGDTYYLSIWVYENTTGRARLLIRWLNDRGRWDNDWSGSYSVDSTGWQELTYSWTAPLSARKAMLGVRFYVSSKDAGPFYIDDAYIQDVTAIHEGDGAPITSFIVSGMGDALRLRLYSTENALASFKVMDVTGRQIASFSRNLNVGANEFSIPMRLSAGIYFVEAEIGDFSRVEKVTVIH